MSSIVEMEQPETSGLSEITAADKRDDVFAAVNDGQNQIMELSTRFGQMQASDLALQPVTDLYCNVGGIVSCTSTKRGDGHQTNPTISHDNLVTANFSASYTVYASQKASDALTEGIRTSLREILSKVPKIVIDTAPDHHCSREMINSAFATLCNPPALHFNAQFGKVVEKHRRRDYFKPYCLLSKRHYTRQPLTIRRRKYGVSQHQRASTEPGVNELTDILKKLKTGDEKQTSTANHRKMQKWKFSPQPMFYALQDQPNTKLAQIKEKSRSLGDFGVQGFHLTSCTPADQKSSQDPLSKDIGAISSGSVTGSYNSAISRVTSTLGKLNMEE